MFCRVLVYETHFLKTGYKQIKSRSLVPSQHYPRHWEERWWEVSAGNRSWASPGLNHAPKATRLLGILYSGGDFCSRAPPGTLGYTFSVLLKYRSFWNERTVTRVLWGYSTVPNTRGRLARRPSWEACCEGWECKRNTTWCWADSKAKPEQIHKTNLSISHSNY